MLQTSPQRPMAYGTTACAALLCILTTVLVGCVRSDAALEEDAYLPEVETLTIDRGLAREFAVTGEIKPQREASYVAEFQSRVEDIEVDLGTKVSEGQVLVRLNAPNVTQSYTTAASAYTTANLNLEQARLSAQKSIEAAQEALLTAQENLRTTQNQSTESRVQADEALNAAKVNLSLSVASAETALQNAVRSVDAVVDSAITSMDVLLEQSDLHADNSYQRETHIGVKDPLLKYNTQVALGALRSRYQTYVPSADHALSFLQETEDMLMDVLQILKNSVTSPQYTQTQLGTDLARITGELTAVRGSISQIQSVQSALNSAQQSTGNSSQAILSAQAAYNATIAGIEATEEQARRRVEEANAALQSAKTSAGITELGARSTLTSISGNLMQARIEQDKLVIRSPFNGYIADLPLVVGNVVQPGNLIVSVEDHDAFKIVTFLSSSEVKKVHVGDPVHAGQEETVNIAAIAPSADAATKKYKVEMTYSGSVLKVGEFIELTFTAGDDVPSDPQIFIPVTAIHIQGTETFVWKIKGENGTARVAKTIVRLGPIEGAFVEVVEGLTDGDIIATKGGRIIEDDGTRVRIIDPLTTASGSHIP